MVTVPVAREFGWRELLVGYFAFQDYKGRMAGGRRDETSQPPES